MYCYISSIFPGIHQCNVFVVGMNALGVIRKVVELIALQPVLITSSLYNYN